MREYLTNQLDNLPCEAFIVDDFNEIDNGNPRVFIERDVPLNRTSIPHTEYVHLSDAMYCFGGNACGMRHASHERETEYAGDWVHVEGVTESLWADQAAAVILAHRSVNDNT